MSRRSTDLFQRRIDEWERLRSDCSDADPGVVGYIAGEVDRLRHEWAMRNRPRPGGRRATDPD